MQVKVTKDNISILENVTIHKGEYNINKVYFEFSEEYSSDLVINAVFKLKYGKAYQVSIINDECNIPSEILSSVGDILLGVYAYKINNDELELRYSPYPTYFTVIGGSYDPTAEESQEITPTQFEQYMQALQAGLNQVSESIKEVNQATDNANDLVDEINQKLENGDFIGPEGKQGPQGIPGKDGVNGQDGIGITTITSGQSTVEEDKTITPVTVQKTDGSSQIFNVEAKNGANGKDGLNGKDGKDATINGQNTVEITTDNNITLEQQENILKFGLDSQLILKQDAEGTDNVFDDGLESPLYALGGDGKSEQVVTTGKNNLNNTLISQTLNGLNIQINEDKSVKIQGTANKNTNIVLNRKPEINTGTYTLYGCKTFIESEENNGWWNAENEPITKTFTTKPVLSSQGFFIYIENGQAINKTYYPMLLKGTYTNENIGDYEPYTGGQPSPSPDYEQPINSIEGSLEFDCRGKNWLNYTESSTEWAGATITTKGTTVTYTPQSDGFAGISHNSNEMNVNLKKGETYTFSQEYVSGNKWTSGTLTNTLHLIDSNGIDTQLKLNDFTEQNYLEKHYNSITLDRDIVKVYSDCLMYSINGMNTPIVMHFQLEKGTKATPYEPYIEPNEVTFNLNDEKLRSVGDVKDELVVDLETGDYYKLKNIEHLELAISDLNSISEDYPGWLNVPNIQDYFPNVNTTINTLAEFKSNITTSGLSIGINTVGQSNLWLEKGKFNLTQAQWKEQYPDLVFKLDYSIPSTETIKLGTLSAEDLAKLKTFEGYNNVTINTNLGLMNIRFTYGLDIKKYVDNKIAELSAQLIRGE